MTILGEQQPRPLIDGAGRSRAIAMQPTRLASRFLAYSVFAAAVGFTSAMVFGFIH